MAGCAAKRGQRGSSDSTCPNAEPGPVQKVWIIFNVQEPASSRLWTTVYTTCGANMPTTASKPVRKIKRSFSISPESDLFIRKMREERKARSESETLDALLSELRTIQQQRAIDAAYTEYYDSLGDQEVTEEHAWGSFAELQLAKEVQ